MNGSLPNRPLPLPKAGWQTYTPLEQPGLSTGLPKVNNGVPTKDIQKGPAGKKGKAGPLTAANKPKSKAKPAPTATGPASAYKPYATYPQTGPASPQMGMSNQQSTSNVRGSVLHWARHHAE
jgi:hypothetical protein